MAGGTGIRSGATASRMGAVRLFTRPVRRRTRRRDADDVVGIAVGTTATTGADRSSAEAGPTSARTQCAHDHADVVPAPAPAPPVEPPPESPPEPPTAAVEPPVQPPAEATQPSALPLGAQALPTKGRIVYRTSYTRLIGITALTYVDWSIDPEKATYELWLRTVDPAGLLDLRSTGTLKSFGIAPDNYVEKIEVANRELRADFDWKMSSVSFVGRGAGKPVTFDEGTQDPLSLQFHLPLLAQAYPWRFSPGSEVTFAVARRNVENYSFVVEGFETTRINGTDVMTLKIDRKRGPDANRRVEIWMAPEFQWLPVRLRFTDYQRGSVGQRPGATTQRPAAARSDRAGAGQAVSASTSRHHAALGVMLITCAFV